ncbi:MAG: hypothetical protein QOE86_1719, partial [Solirubrobacteraceae bacterium]|nr:hypothetical protein [Solirubrobacteraceae bacterium]
DQLEKAALGTAETAVARAGEEGA